MRTSLLHRVKSKLFIRANRKAIHLLEGEYGSFTRGRSLDFDDLRSYVAGDEVKDIDWKATARHGSPLVKRYIASRRQQVVFIVDSGPKLAARSRSMDPKVELAILALGVLGYLAVRHGDEVSAVIADDGKPVTFDSGTTEGHLERILRRVSNASTLDKQHLGITALLEHSAKTLRKRGIVVVLSDEVEVDSALETAIRRLSHRHELLWLTISDADPIESAGKSFDVIDGIEFPDFLKHDRKLTQKLQAASERRREEARELFTRLGISYQFLESQETTIQSLFAMLRRRQHAGV